MDTRQKPSRSCRPGQNVGNGRRQGGGLGGISNSTPVALKASSPTSSPLPPVALALRRQFHLPDLICWQLLLNDPRPALSLGNAPIRDSGAYPHPSLHGSGWWLHRCSVTLSLSRCPSHSLSLSLPLDLRVWGDIFRVARACSQESDAGTACQRSRRVSRRLRHEFAECHPLGPSYAVHVKTSLVV
jgi:hypothetical protein